MKSVFLMYFSTAFKGVLTCFIKKEFCKAQNRSKNVFKYLINRNKNRIETVSKTYLNLLYYFKTIFIGKILNVF